MRRRLFNLLPNDKILDWPKFKAFADDKINVTENMKSCSGKVCKHCGKRRKCWWMHGGPSWVTLEAPPQHVVHFLRFQKFPTLQKSKFEFLSYIYVFICKCFEFGKVENFAFG